ncbi:MAG: zinc ribbon domain-containing protein [Acidobacteria bacterium]|nr:zinc ribbon domain-containing protein [Acidobacteriota bacterium]
MNCPQCNESLPDGTKFCINCGLRLNITSSMPTHPTPIQGIPQTSVAPLAMVPSPQQPPQVQQNLPIGQALSPLPGGIIPAYNQYQAEGERNFLEKIATKIPGYKGYLEKESRRDVDKLHREHLATLLFQLKAPLHTVIRELTDNRRLFEIGPIEKAIQKLDKVENRIRYASYGYAGFFDAVKIREDQLDQLYHFDLALVEDVEKIKFYVQKLMSQLSDAKALKTAAQELMVSIDDLDAKFNQRYQAIENPGWSPF